MAAIIGLGGPSTATKIAVDSLGGPLAAGDQLRRDSSLVHASHLEGAQFQKCRCG